VPSCQEVYSARPPSVPHRRPCLLITAWIYPPDNISIETHLTSCDFCRAALQLLKRYCGEAEEYSFVEMPSQLQRLAEHRLKTSARDDQRIRGAR
jgi:hypothetical protein